MIVNKLKENLSPFLQHADEIWIAVALMKDDAFESIQGVIPLNCKQHYLVGIDLPTTPSVLRTLMTKSSSDKFEASIYKSEFNYHPKVYLIKSSNNYTAFIGSSNLTNGGFENNIELNYQVTRQEDCLEILNWFNEIYQDGYPLTFENIATYESEYNSINISEEHSKRKRKAIKLKKKIANEDIFSNIDFNNRYFKKEHHLAFRKELWLSDSDKSIEERELAKKRCIQLHETIFPQFKDYGIQVLKPNPMPNHLTSMIRQIDPTNPRAINSIWLSYGKTANEIKKYQKLVGPDQKDKQTFINHARLQIKINLNSIGIWFLFAKENEGGLFDREFLKTELIKKTFRDKFYQMLKSLSKEYFISVGGERKFCYKFNSPEELHDFCKKDHIQKYFIIGRDYEITDNEMSINNLPTETLKVFKLLFPYYEIMRHRI